MDDPVVPQLDFRGQPLGEDDAAGEFLRRVLEDPAINSLRTAVAWVRFGGVARLLGPLSDFRDRGGMVEVVLGIDEGGATRPGLTKVLRSVDRALVFHDPSGGTFHPKLYLAEGETKAYLLVGSSNATPGGLYFNYEASLEAEFALPDEKDEPALVGARRYLDLLIDDSEVCVGLSEDLIDTLAKDPRYRIATTERRRGRSPVAKPPEGAEDDEVDSIVEDAAGEGAPVFGKTRNRRGAIPRLSDEARAELAALEAEAGALEEEREEPPGEAAAATAPPPGTSAEWSKPMSRADAQHPSSPGTNPTGVLRLAKAGHKINHRTWFRESLFGPAGWTPGRDSRGNPIETAVVPMHVDVAGTDMGTVDIQVDHAPHREEDQHNVTTILHWGDQLGPVLRSTDYTDHEVVLRRLDDGSYRLQITP